MQFLFRVINEQVTKEYSNINDWAKPVLNFIKKGEVI